MNFRHPTEVYFIFTVWSPPCGRGSAWEGQAVSWLTADKWNSSWKPQLSDLTERQELQCILTLSSHPHQGDPNRIFLGGWTYKTRHWQWRLFLQARGGWNFQLDKAWEGAERKEKWRKREGGNIKRRRERERTEEKVPPRLWCESWPPPGMAASRSILSTSSWIQTGIQQERAR